LCPRVTIEYKKEKKSQILRSAIKCFSKYGFDKTRMEDIVNESELSKGTLYNYFSSKEDLFQAIAEDSLNLLYLQLTNTFTKNREDIISNTERFYDEFRKIQREGSEKVFFEAIAESSRNPKLQKILRDHRKKLYKISYDHMQLQIKKGWFKEDINLELIAAGVVSLFDGLTIGRILGIPETYNKKVWVEINQLVLDGIKST
jgi:AcrR family transcriptional regulator